MGTKREIPTGTPFDLSSVTVGLERSTGRAWFMEWEAGPPPRIDGYTVGAPMIVTEPPHAGEMHPDADELLYLVSGRVRVRLELDDGTREVALNAEQAIVVPRGVWHRIFIEEPGRLVHITPGPGGDHRPLPQG
ncbi:MAG TPA: cupin domain-containing protein [Acidimicrobiia bacterium]|jgi:mannose-6-phosphate isomerase-like protein (cupin superfamily)|nr:cupin domain-containing protein [Acidimicrobiia bacterium]